MSRLIIWGAGDLGSRVASRWEASPILGLTQTERRHEDLRALGVTPRTGSAAPLLQPDDWLLLTLPGDETKAAALAALAGTPPPRRAVLASTTGYYGTPQGTLDEESAPGEGERAQRIAALERAFLNWAGAGGVVVRLGGLYRSGRGPTAALARRGHPRLRPPNRSLALIHYDDAAAAIAAALRRPQVAPIYLAVTPPVPTRRQFYEAACRRLGLDPPEFAPPLPHPPARYDVSRLRRDLLPQPAFPNWRAALE